MKTFYLTMSIIFTVLILIVAFENIGSTCTNMMFFFFSITSSPALILLGISILGVITGVFYHLFFTKFATPSDEDDNM
ncbi:MAG: hypothetical protein WC269_01540 [Candidatus Gracilibacteria bacterium]